MYSKSFHTASNPHSEKTVRLLTVLRKIIEEEIFDEFVYGYQIVRKKRAYQQRFLYNRLTGQVTPKTKKSLHLKRAIEHSEWAYVIAIIEISKMEYHIEIFSGAKLYKLIVNNQAVRPLKLILDDIL